MCVGVESKSCGVMLTYLLSGGCVVMVVGCGGTTVSTTVGVSKSDEREDIDVEARFDIGARSKAEVGLCVRGTAGMT